MLDIGAGCVCEFGGGVDSSCALVGVGCRKPPVCTLLYDVGMEECRDWKFGCGAIGAEATSCAMGIVVFRWIRGVESAELGFGAVPRLLV